MPVREATGRMAAAGCLDAAETLLHRAAGAISPSLRLTRSVYVVCRLGDIVLDYVTQGLRAGNKCICVMDTASSVRERVPRELVSREDILQFFTADEAYMPDGHFSKDGFIHRVEEIAKQAFTEGYERARLLGDDSFVIRNGVDVKSWLAAESEASEAGVQHLRLTMPLT